MQCRNRGSGSERLLVAMNHVGRSRMAAIARESSRIYSIRNVEKKIPPKL